MGEPFGESITLSAVWPTIEEIPVIPANAFLYQLTTPTADGLPDGAIVTLGYLAPPAVTGPPEHQIAMLQAIGAVAVRTLGRYQLSRPRLQELIQGLQAAADNWDQVLASAPKQSGGQQ